MMSKGLIAFIVTAAVGIVLIFMRRSAGIASSRSDQIIEEFKTIDNNLHKTDARLDSAARAHLDSLMKANK